MRDDFGNGNYGAGVVRELLNRHGVRLTKSLGQNFLVDRDIPEKIVRSSGIDESCGVLEVGPGIGALTMELSRAAGRVLAVELDRRLIPILDDVLDGRENTEIVQGDILKLDIGKMVNEKMPGFRLQVCANLPYNITSPVLGAIIDSGLFDTITVMVQREMARRICAHPGSPDYSAFSVYVNYHAEPSILFSVPPECFYPRPQVFSSVVMIKVRKERLLAREVETVFFRVVRAAFGQRRKTLVNALFSAFGNSMSKESLADIVNQCGFGAQIRGETLSVSDFIRLSEYFSEKI